MSSHFCIYIRLTEKWFLFPGPFQPQNTNKEHWHPISGTMKQKKTHKLTVLSSPPRPISPINAISFGIGNSKKLKRRKKVT